MKEHHARTSAQTRRTANSTWHPEDILKIHPWDAESRGILEGDLVSVASRKGETTLHAKITEFADWATDCPEYKVTAVQVRKASQRSEWQKKYEELREATTHVGAA